MIATLFLTSVDRDPKARRAVAGFPLALSPALL